jgi:serine/threonine-protein kinase RsbW
MMTALAHESVWAGGAGNANLGDDWQAARLSSTGEVAPLVEAVAAAMAALGYGRKDLFGMRLALEEALVNAIKHGHRYDRAKVVRVRYRVCQEHALVEVEDEGPGFDPFAVPDPTAAENLGRPCGRGVLLMRSYLTGVRYSGRGNCVTLWRRRS